MDTFLQNGDRKTALSELADLDVASMEGALHFEVVAQEGGAAACIFGCGQHDS